MDTTELRTPRLQTPYLGTLDRYSISTEASAFPVRLHDLATSLQATPETSAKPLVVC